MPKRKRGIKLKKILNARNCLMKKMEIKNTA
jgi:hypothetical protein